MELVAVALLGYFFGLLSSALFIVPFLREQGTVNKTTPVKLWNATPKTKATRLKPIVRDDEAAYRKEYERNLQNHHSLLSDPERT